MRDDPEQPEWFNKIMRSQQSESEPPVRSSELVRRRAKAKKRPTILSYGLLEHAANACGFSFAGMMSEKEQLKVARGLRHLRKPAQPNGKGQR